MKVSASVGPPSPSPETLAITSKKNILKIRILLLTLCISLQLYAQKTYVYFGSYNVEKSSEGIYVYELNNDTGNLTKITSISGFLNPSFLAVSKDGKTVFSGTESRTKDEGGVRSFNFNAEKKSLEYINHQKSGGINPVFLTLHKNGKWLVNANYNDGSFSIFPIGKNGKLEPYVQNFKFDEGSINRDRQETSHVHAATFSPDGKYLFLPDLGADKIRCYEFKNDKKQPLKECEVPFTKTFSGNGPRHLIFHPNGKFAYGTEELSGTVSVYSYVKGSLKNIQTLVNDADQKKKNLETSDVQVSPDGRFLYVGNRGTENNIIIYAVAENGTLKVIGQESTFGKNPRVFAIAESGKFLITTNTVSGDVAVLERNSETGLLKKAGKDLNIKGVSSVVIRTVK